MIPPFILTSGKGYDCCVGTANDHSDMYFFSTLADSSSLTHNTINPLPQTNSSN